MSQEPIIDESYLNRGTVAFQFFDGVINRVVAIAIFSMNDTRKNSFGIIFFINFFYHTYTLFNLFYCIEVLSMIIRWVISISVFFTDSRFDVIEWISGGCYRVGSNFDRANRRYFPAIEIFYHGITNNCDNFLFSFSFAFSAIFSVTTLFTSTGVLSFPGGTSLILCLSFFSSIYVVTASVWIFLNKTRRTVFIIAALH